MKLSDYSFRDMYRQCVILKGEWVYSGAVNMLTDYSYIAPANMNAALCFCYIDSDAGMSFHFLCFANFETCEIDKNSYEKILQEKCIFMFRASSDLEIRMYTKDVSIFSCRINMVDEGYHKDKKVLSTRNIIEIDHLRNSCFPDDIQVLLRKKGLKSELVWVRLSEIKNGNVFGTLLNEPSQSFGVHGCDKVSIRLGTLENKVFAVVEVV